MGPKGPGKRLNMSLNQQRFEAKPSIWIHQATCSTSVRVRVCPAMNPCNWTNRQAATVSRPSTHCADRHDRETCAPHAQLQPTITYIPMEGIIQARRPRETGCTRTVCCALCNCELEGPYLLRPTLGVVESFRNKGKGARSILRELGWLGGALALNHVSVHSWSRESLRGGRPNGCAMIRRDAYILGRGAWRKHSHCSLGRPVGRKCMFDKRPPTDRHPQAAW
jgi:hypothetical protein